LFNIDSGVVRDIETSAERESLDGGTGKGDNLSLNGSAEYAFPPPHDWTALGKDGFATQNKKKFSMHW
jgi:hypothetical protein